MRVPSLWRGARAALYVLVIAGYPLVAPLPSLFGFSSRLVSVPLRAIVVAASLAILVGAFVSKNELSLGSLALPLLLFWGLYSVRLVLDTVIRPVAVILQPGYDWLFALGTCILPMLAFFLPHDEALLRRARIWTLIACLVACVGAVEAVGKEAQGGSGYFVDGGRLGFATLNPVSLGNLGVTATILGFTGLFFRNGTTKLVKAFATAAVVLGAAISTLAGSRGPIFALSVALALFLVTLARDGRLADVLVLGLLITAGVAPSLTESGLFLRFVALGRSASDPSVGVHHDLLLNSWQQFLSRPFLGSGLVETNTGFYPHNIVLEGFMATGIVGGVALLFALSGVSWMALRMALSRGEQQWIALLYFQYLIAALLSGAVIGSGTMWCLLAAVMSVHHAIEPRTPRVAN